MSTVNVRARDDFIKSRLFYQKVLDVAFIATRIISEHLFYILGSFVNLNEIFDLAVHWCLGVCNSTRNTI